MAIAITGDAMDTRFEAEAMRLFERALEQPPGLRAVWLQRQDAAPEIAARVGDLLAKEAALTRFLEQPAAVQSASSVRSHESCRGVTERVRTGVDSFMCPAWPLAGGGRMSRRS